MNRSAVPQHVVVTPTKSVGIQLLLIFIFGPLGLFYSTIKGALIMLFGVPAAFVLLGIVTAIGGAASHSDAAGVAALVALGSEIFLMIAAWWIGSFIWGILAVNSYNRKLLASTR